MGSRRCTAAALAPAPELETEGTPAHEELEKDGAAADADEGLKVEGTPEAPDASTSSSPRIAAPARPALIKALSNEPGALLTDAGSGMWRTALAPDPTRALASSPAPTSLYAAAPKAAPAPAPSSSAPLGETGATCTMAVAKGSAPERTSATGAMDGAVWLATRREARRVKAHSHEGAVYPHIAHEQVRALAAGSGAGLRRM